MKSQIEELLSWFKLCTDSIDHKAYLNVAHQLDLKVVDFPSCPCTGSTLEIEKCHQVLRGESVYLD